MTSPQQDRCVLTRHDVQSIKDLVFIIGENSESSAQKAIFEILANNMRESRPAPSHPTLYTPEMVENRIKHAVAQARNQTLDKIIPTLGRAIQTDISDNDYVMIEDLESVIESLRRTPGGEPR